MLRKVVLLLDEYIRINADVRKIVRVSYNFFIVKNTISIQ
jgi:hypothetical protein